MSRFGDKFILGVNYWPRRKAMYWWSDFDREEVRDDFALISELGMQVVRIFLLWDDWQPESDRVNSRCMRHLESVCDAAHEYGLALDVTFFTGHMSGPNWAPRWLLSPDAQHPSPHVKQVISGGQVVPGSYRNPFNDSEALSAARLLIREVVGTFSDHPAVWLWNLGNEPDLFAWPRKKDDLARWLDLIVGELREADDRHPVTCGLHVESLQEDNNLRVDQVFKDLDLAVMHGYPMYLDWSLGPLDHQLVPFLTALTRELSGKPVMMEEWGGCTALPGQNSYVREWTLFGKPRQQFMANEEEFADYVGKVLPGLMSAGAFGSMLWCFADYAEALWDKPPCDQVWHERYFGLVRPDGSIKPHAETIKAFARRNPKVSSKPERSVELDCSIDDYYRDPKAHLVRLYRTWTER